MKKRDTTLTRISRNTLEKLKKEAVGKNKNIVEILDFICEEYIKKSYPQKLNSPTK